MRAAIRVAAATLIVLLTVIGAASDRTAVPAQACGPFIDFAVFTSPTTPELPAFVQGNLGIIQPSYSRRYLVAAWRALERRPLTELEQQAYLPLSSASARGNPVQGWLDARGAVPGVTALTAPLQQNAWLSGQDYFAYFVNCGDSAFDTAVDTLADRRRRLGDQSPIVLDWIRAQDTVFANCARQAGTPPSVPTMLSAEAPALAQADRAYQIAAAHFYAGQFAEAEAAFTAIARDNASPWRTIAPYLAARAIVRQATIGGPKAAGDPAAFARAMTAVNTILHDSTRQETYEATRRLRQFIVSKTQPRDVLLEAASKLASPAHAVDFAERLTDYEYLGNRAGSAEWFGSSAPGNEAADLLDWVLTFRKDGSEALEHAVTRWQHSRSTTWLVAVMVLVPPGHPQQQELMSAATAIDQRSPAYPTLAFHRVRLLLRGGQAAEARTLLDHAMTTPGLPISSLNLFKAARLQTARDLDEFVADAARVSLGDLDPDRNFVPTRGVDVDDVLDRDVIDVLNERMPVSMLRRVASSPALPPPARQALVLSVFTRALLLEQWAVARAMLPEVASAEPSLAPLLRALDTPDDTRLRDEAALLLIRMPGLRPFVPAWSFRDPGWSDYSKPEALGDLNGLRDNWWCSFHPPDSPEVGYYYPPMLKRGSERVSPQQAVLYADPTALPSPAFLTAAERQAAAEEWRGMSRIDTAPNELGRRVVEWARRHPSDPRAPEMLHRVVRATRSGCTNDGTGAVSKAAFELLHRRYPTSPWTGRTPHWFK